MMQAVGMGSDGRKNRFAPAGLGLIGAEIRDARPLSVIDISGQEIRRVGRQSSWGY